jgi:hypothetical protein
MHYVTAPPPVLLGARKRLNALAALSSIQYCIDEVMPEIQLSASNVKVPMRKLSTLLRRPSKLTVKIAIAIAAAIGMVVGLGAPAHADPIAETYSLQVISQTHHCVAFDDDDTEYTGAFCVDLALYHTEAGGYDITLQVEGYCQNYGGSYVPCADIGVYTGSVASKSYTDWTGAICSTLVPEPPCPIGATGRTYFWPFGGIPIAVGTCLDDIWGVIQSTSYIEFPDEDPQWLSGQLETGHWNVCLNPGKAISATSA